MEYGVCVMRLLKKFAILELPLLLLYCSTALLLFCSISPFTFHAFTLHAFTVFFTLHAFTLHAKKSPLPLFKKMGFFLSVIVFNYPSFVKGELQGGFSTALLLYCSIALLLYRYGVCVGVSI